MLFLGDAYDFIYIISVFRQDKGGLVNNFQGNCFGIRRHDIDAVALPSVLFSGCRAALRRRKVEEEALLRKAEAEEAKAHAAVLERSSR